MIMFDKFTLENIDVNDNDDDEIFEANDEIIDDDNISDFCSACGHKLYENKYGYLVCPRCDDDGNDAA